MGRFSRVSIMLGLTLTASAAQAQTDIDALRSSLTETLSLLSFGAISVGGQAARVTQSGADVQIQIPLNGFAAPAAASVVAMARPAANGAWDLTSVTVPPAGALGSSIDNVVSYTLGRQSMHGRLDPQRLSPSTFLAELGAIALHSASGGQDTEQTIERVTLNAASTAASAGRLDLLAKNSASSWHVVTRESGGEAAESHVRHLDGQIALYGLDHQQAARLMAAANGLMQTDRRPPASSIQRHDMQEMLDATAGLLSRFDASQVLTGLKFDRGDRTAGTMGRLRLDAKGSAEDRLLNAGLDVAMDDLSLTSLSADTAALLPHHLTARTVVAGLPVAAVTALLRAGLVPNPDTAALQTRAAGMLATPGAKAAIESFAFDAGPLHVQGSARFLSRPNGDLGTDIHISASGTDALLSQAMGKPGLQGALPMVFLAKGMGRVQGDSIVWDISLGGGAMTINGVAFGQPAGHTR